MDTTKKRANHIQAGDVIDFDQHNGIHVHWQDTLTKHHTEWERATGQQRVAAVEPVSKSAASGMGKASSRYYLIRFVNGRTVQVASQSKLPVVEKFVGGVRMIPSPDGIGSVPEGTSAGGLWPKGTGGRALQDKFSALMA